MLTRKSQAAASGNDTLLFAYQVVPTGQSFIGPYSRTPADVKSAILRGDFRWYDRSRKQWVSIPAGIQTPTLVEGIERYYQRPAYKSPTPKVAGYLPPPVLSHIDRIMVIGKETNAAAQMTADETDDNLMAREAGMEGATVYGVEMAGLQERLRAHPLSDVLLSTGLPRQTIKDIKNGTTVRPSDETLAAITRGLWLLNPANPSGIAGWRDIPNSELAAMLGADWTVDDMWEVRGGRGQLTPMNVSSFSWRLWPGSPSTRRGVKLRRPSGKRYWRSGHKNRT